MKIQEKQFKDQITRLKYDRDYYAKKLIDMTEMVSQYETALVVYRGRATSFPEKDVTKVKEYSRDDLEQGYLVLMKTTKEMFTELKIIKDGYKRGIPWEYFEEQHEKH